MANAASYRQVSDQYSLLIRGAYLPEKTALESIFPKNNTLFPRGPPVDAPIEELAAWGMTAWGRDYIYRRKYGFLSGHKWAQKIRTETAIISRSENGVGKLDVWFNEEPAAIPYRVCIHRTYIEPNTSAETTEVYGLWDLLYPRLRADTSAKFYHRQGPHSHLHVNTHEVIESILNTTPRANSSLDHILQDLNLHCSIAWSDGFQSRSMRTKTAGIDIVRTTNPSTRH